MKIIELLNKIANHDKDIPNYIEYYDREKVKRDIMLVCEENIIYYMNRNALFLNDEVEIIEEPQEHKIPEKLKIRYKENDILVNEKILQEDINDELADKINEIIDYINKGD